MVVIPNLSRGASPRFPAVSACIIAANGIAEKYCSVAMASWHWDTRTTSKCGMFLLALSQWALMLEWSRLSKGLNTWQGGHQSGLK